MQNFYTSYSTKLISLLTGLRHNVKNFNSLVKPGKHAGVLHESRSYVSGKSIIALMALCMFMGVTSSVFGQADFTVTPATKAAVPNEVFNLTVVISTSEAANGGEVHMTFDETILKVNSITTTGPFFNLLLPPLFDNINGTIDYAAGISNFGAPVDGTFDFLIIEVEAIGNGIGVFDFNGIKPSKITSGVSAGTVILDSATGAEITVASANESPIADFTINPTAASTNEVVTFDGLGSTDDGTIVSYAWDFGDGTTQAASSNSSTTHSYTAVDTYTVALTVTDNLGAMNTATKTIIVTAPTVNQFTVNSSSNGNGSIAPAGAVSVNEGSDQLFTFTPDAGFEVSEVLVGGVPVLPVPTTSYILLSVSAPETISVSFSLITIDTEPEITLAATATVGEGETINVPLSISDADGDNLTVTITSISNEPQELQSSNTGVQTDPYPFDASGFLTESSVSSSAGNYSSSLVFNPTFGDGGSNGDGNGVYTITVQVADEDGNSITQDIDVTVTDVAQIIADTGTTRLEAESYDNQGPANTGSGGNGIGVEVGTITNIGFTTNGDFAEYSINVETAGTYQFDFYVSKNSTAANTMTINGGPASITVPNYGDWVNYSNVVSANVDLAAGSQTLRFDWSGPSGFYFNMDYFEATKVTDAPFQLCIASGNNDLMAYGRSFIGDPNTAPPTGLGFTRTNGKIYTNYNGAIAGTSTADELILFQKEIYGGKTGTTGADPSYIYDIPVANGFYQVDLYFAEVFHPASGGRIFDVTLDGNRILDEYDLVDPVKDGLSANQTAITRTYFVQVTDGVMSLQIGDASTDNGKLSGLCVTAVTSANLHPVTAIGDLTYDALVAVSDPLNIVDPENDELSIVFNGLPASLSYDPTTNQIQGTPLATDANTYTINAIISDGTNSPITEEFTLVINPAAGNDAPIIDAIADLEVNEGEAISQEILVTDDNLPAATIEIFDVSDGGTNNPFAPTTAVAVGTLVDNSGGSYTFNWTPAAGTGRSYLARVSADDGVNPVVTEEFRINVAQQVPGTILARTFNNPDPWYGSSTPGAGYSVAIETSPAQNIGYIDNGDFVEYLINIPSAGVYDLEVFAGKGNGGTTVVTFLEENAGGFATIGSVNVIQTGWQNFQPYTTQVSFSNPGVQTLRFEFNGGANIRDFNFTIPTSNNPPVVTISTPVDGIALTTGTSLDFIGSVEDVEDDDATLTAALNWSSNLDGPLGTPGGTISSVLTTVGTHTITAEVTDLDATTPLTGSATITLVVTETDPSCDARFRVNAGGPLLIASSGDFEEDQAAAAGNAGSSAVAGTPSSYVNITAPAVDKTFGSLTPLVENNTGYPDFLFQTERYSDAANPNNMNWSFPTGDGVYDVKILFNENWVNENASVTNNRIFDVIIEGNIVLDDYRPSGPTGADFNIAKVEIFQATVTDGVLNIDFEKINQNPSVKGFDICFVSDLPTDTPPTVAITGPTNINVSRGTNVSFSGEAIDVPDGDISATINWFSDDNETVYSTGTTGAAINASFVRPGSTIVTANATDIGGLTGSDTFTVNVSAPEVTFAAPQESEVLTSFTVNVEVDPTDVLFDNTEHFHVYINPADINDLDPNTRISTAPSAPWKINDTNFVFDENSGALAMNGSGNGIQEGPNTIVIRVADQFHNEFMNPEAQAIVNFTVELSDVTDPIAVCQDITVQLDASGNASITAADIDGGSTDNVAIDNLAVDISEFDINNVGANTVTLTVTDVSGNSATCTATVTVEDNVPPTAICQNIVVALDANGIANITAAAIDNGSNDASGIASLSVSPSTFDCNTAGENTVTLTVTDNNGKEASCTATVTIIDDTPPVLVDCPGNRLITSPSDQILVLTPPTATDACGVNTVTGTRSDGLALTDAYQVGTVTTITWMATDPNGAVGTCQTIVTITAPVSGGKEITGFDVAGQVGNESIDSGAGTIALTVSTGTPVTALAPTIAISNAASISPASGAVRDFSNPQTYTVTAEDNTTKEWTVTISVAPDTEAPVVDCPENIVVVNDSGECGAVVDFTATASDNVGVVSLSYSVPIGYVFDVGTTMVMVTATDAAGLTASCSFDVTVNDMEAPVVSCPGDQTEQGDINGDVAMPDYTGLASVLDNCEGSTLITQNPLPGTVISGITLVTLTTEDTEGNSGSCTFDVTVIPETPPSLTIVPSAITVNLIQGESTMVTYVVDSDDASTLPTPAAMSIIDNATNNAATWASTTSAANQGTSYEVNLDATGLAPGTYNATLTAGPVTGYTNTSIPITLIVASAVGNGALIVLDATTDTPLFDLTDGLQISKATIGNTPLGIIFNTSFNPGGVVFSLSGPITENRTEGPAPHSLFGDIGVNIQGKPFPVGNYTLVANPNVGPTITMNFSVTDVDPLCANFNASLTGVTSPTTCSGVGSATAVPSGGVAPFTYQWDNAETTATASSLTAGPHSVIVRDANGCSKTLTLTITGPSLPAVTLAPFAPVLNTAPAFVLTGGSPATGTYSGPGVINNTFDPASVGVGTYAITYSYTDPNGCANSATRNITVTTETSNAALIVLDATDDSELFALTDGLQISKATIGNTPLGIIFNSSLNPGGVVFSLSGPITENRTEGPAPHSLFGDIGIDIQGKVFPVGNYTLVANPNVGPTITVNFSVTDVDPLCANFNASLTGVTSPTTCSGVGSATAVPSGGVAPFTYQWDNAETTATASSLTVGPHSVIVRDANGCSKTLTLTITGPSLPAVTLAPFAPVLNTAPAFTLTGGSPVGGDYSYLGEVITTFDPAIGVGTYAITYSYTDPNGCANSATRNITVTTETSNAALIVLDATDDSELFALTDGLQIDKSAIGNTPLGIIFNANLNPGGVQFRLTGPITEIRTEGASAPYSLFGDIGVNIQGKPFPVGNYTLVANPNVGPTITVNFSVINGTLGNQPSLAARTQLNEMSIAPNPANVAVTVSFDEPILVEEILIFDVTGRLIKTIREPLGLDSRTIDFNVIDLPTGTYFIKTTDSKGMQYQQQMLIERY